MAESSDDPRDERVVLELGAGQALLGRLVSRITSAPLVAVDRRDTGDAPRSSHDDDHEDEKDDASAPAAESDPPTPKMTRVVVDLTRCAYDELLADANLAPHHLNDADAPLRRRRRQAPVRGRHRRRRSPRRRRRHATPRSRRRRVSRARALLPPADTPRRIQRRGVARTRVARRREPNRRRFECSGPRGVRARFGARRGDEGARGRVRRDAGEVPREIARRVDGDLRGFPRLRRLGRIARRALEHGRAEALRAGGFPDARVCRYVDAATSPDNLVIVAGTPVVAGASSSGVCSGAARAPARVPTPTPRWTAYPREASWRTSTPPTPGREGSLSRRVAEYLLESRGGRCLRGGTFRRWNPSSPRPRGDPRGGHRAREETASATEMRWGRATIRATIRATRR